MKRKSSEKSNLVIEVPERTKRSVQEDIRRMSEAIEGAAPKRTKRKASAPRKSSKNEAQEIAPGTGNRLAEGASLLGTGNDPKDHRHVETWSPLQHLIHDLPDASELGIDGTREAHVSRLRAKKN